MSSTSQPCGVDSTGIVKQSTIGSVRAQYGMVPLFWGRYFKGPGDIDPTDFQYKYKRENGVLESNGIKLLPIARQTSNVGGSERDGERDGKHNAAAIIEALGANYLTQSDVEPLVFLDTEPEGSGPALSFDYYVGWANGLIAEGLRQTANKVFFQPGVYLNSGGREGNGPKAARVIAKVAEHVANNQLDQRLLCWAGRLCTETGHRCRHRPPGAIAKRGCRIFRVLALWWLGNGPRPRITYHGFQSIRISSIRPARAFCSITCLCRLAHRFGGAFSEADPDNGGSSLRSRQGLSAPL